MTATCDPQLQWKRSNDGNIKRLLRQYFPKRTDLPLYSQANVSAIARQLGERRRKTRNYQTPADRFQACVAPPDEPTLKSLTWLPGQLGPKLICR